MCKMGFLTLAVVMVVVCNVHAAASKPPNILFIIDESTDAKAYFYNKTAPMPIPNLQMLMKEGTTLLQHYVNAPVCAVSRASLWSGRYPHRLPHMQENPATGLYVTGVWNNHEGLSKSNQTYADYMRNAGYNVGIFGKTDYTAGGHSVDCRVTAWTNKVKFPYTFANHSAGWIDEGGPIARNVSGSQGGRVVHESDWNHAQATSDFINKSSNADKPWLAYVGFDIVHPDYVTSDYWLSQVNESMVTSPHWIPRNQLHPEDLQSVMKKNMASDLCCSDDFKRNIRRHYYAMIAEYDAIIGTIFETVKQLGEWDNTYIIATSDHGDMNMEHQQYYKMVFYDPSSRVPMIVRGPGIRQGTSFSNLTSHVDLLPTILDMGNAPLPHDAGLDGRSLMPILTNGSDPGRENQIMSQFHGDEIHLSWFMLRKDQYKYVTYGSGSEVVPRLYDMQADPLEFNDMAKSKPDIVKQMDSELRKVIDYPDVARQAEEYNKDSFARWRDSFSSHDDYVKAVSNLRWKSSWEYDPDGCLNAIDDWLKTPNDTFHWAM